MKNKIIKLLVLATLSFGVVACGKKEQREATNTIEAEKTDEKVETSENNKTDKEKIVVKIGTQPGDIVNNIALKNGYFEEENVDVDVQVFSYGPPIVEALTSKDLDIGFMGDQPAFSAISNGIDIEIISKYKASNQLHGIVARDDTGIETLEDLKGKRVSVPIGSNAQPLLYLYLEAAGLTEDDVEIVNLGVADAATSIIAGDIDAAVLWEPRFRNVATKENKVHILAYAEGYKSYVSINVVRTEFGKEHAEEIAKLLRAWQKAANWAQENPEEAAKIVNEIDGTDIEATLTILQYSDSSIDLTEDNIKALEEGEEQSFKFELIKNDFNVNDYINTSYLELSGLR